LPPLPPIATKRPSEAFATIIDRLLQITKVTTEADLPQLWPDLTASPACQCRWILNKAVINCALETSAATSVPPIITKIL
jgi:hypothetical protein